MLSPIFENVAMISCRRSSSTGSFSTSLNAANDGLGFDESSGIGRGDDRGSSDKQKKARLVGNRVDRSLQVRLNPL